MNKRWAALYANKDFIQISTESGYGSVLIDPLGEQIDLRPDASDREMGDALLKCLASSRLVKPSEDPDFFDFDGRVDRDYHLWLGRLMANYNYKTKNRLFKKMIHCPIEQEENFISIRPTRHVKLEAWEGNKKDMPLETISKYSAPEEIGAALRRAMEKCIP